MVTSITIKDKEILTLLGRIKGYRFYKDSKKRNHSDLIKELCDEELKRIGE
jgi:hypothetical protein